MTMSINEYRELQKEKKKPRRKYFNVKVEACPACWMKLIQIKNTNLFDCKACSRSYTRDKFVVFDSITEWEYGLLLKKREERGEISNLITHPLYQMDELNYKPDFRYTDSHGLTVVDIKGFDKKKQLPIIHNPTAFKIKLNRMFEQHGIEVEIVAGGHAWVIDQRPLKRMKLIKIY